MNKWKVLLLALFAAIGLVITGCSQQESNPSPAESQTGQNQSSENEEAIVITLSKNQGAEVLEEKEIVIEDGAILMDVMKENFEIEESDGFITSINGISQDQEAGKYWLYEVNDEMASVGANELVLNAGDKVSFDLSAME